MRRIIADYRGDRGRRQDRHRRSSFSWAGVAPWLPSVLSDGRRCGDARDFVATTRRASAQSGGSSLSASSRPPEQIAERNAPARRIIIAERCQGPTLPRIPNHTALGIVAAAKGLAFEQMRRAAVATRRLRVSR